MIGGTVGAFSAYLIARFQLTKQLDLQDQKDKSRILLEVRLRKAEEVLEILTRTRMDFLSLNGSWMSFLMDYENFISDKKKEKANYKDLKNEPLLEALAKQRDKFINTYFEVYKYKPYFRELIEGIEKDHDDFFKDLTLNMIAVANRITGIDKKYSSYMELHNSIVVKLGVIDNNIRIVFEAIEEEINQTEKLINDLLIEFNQN